MMDTNNLMDKINIKIVAVVILLIFVIIGGAGFAILSFLGGGGSVSPQPSNYELSYDQNDNSVNITQTGGDSVVTESIVLEISYENANQSEDIQLQGIGQTYSVQLNQDPENVQSVQLMWNGETEMLLNQLDTDSINTNNEDNNEDNDSDTPSENINVSVNDMQYNESETIQLSVSDYISGQYQSIDQTEWSIGEDIVYTQNQIMIPPDVLSSGSYNSSVNVTIDGQDYQSQFTVNVTSQSNEDDEDNNEENATDDNTTEDTLNANITIVSINNRTVEFSASNSEISDNLNISSYEWRFSENESVSNMNESVTHEYASDGDYIAELTLVTESELEDTTSVSVTINQSDNGTDDGTNDGTDDGTNDGTDDGTNDGTDDGTNDGTDDGTNDGTDDGTNDDSINNSDVVIQWDNKGDNSWVVTSISGDTESNVLGQDNYGDNNPSLSLEVGTRYEFAGIPQSKWEEDVTMSLTDIVRNPLLSQKNDAKYNNDSSVNFVDEGDRIAFTLTSDLADDVSSYSSPESSDMSGDINIRE